MRLQICLLSAVKLLVRAQGSMANLLYTHTEDAPFLPFYATKANNHQTKTTIIMHLIIE